MNIIDKHNLLTPTEVNRLQKQAAAPFKLGRFTSLEDILTSLTVDVIIEPGVVIRSVPPLFDEAEQYWREKADEMKWQFSNDRPMMQDDEEEIWQHIKEIMKNKENWENMPLRGLYNPSDCIIKLFPEEMRQEYGGRCMEELLISTLAHETMHAYFNRYRHKSYPYVIFVEEPLAEFGMLLYLYEIESPFYDWAFQDVSSKQTCYRYGAKLMEQHLNTLPLSDEYLYLRKYKFKLHQFAMPIMNHGTISMPGNSTTVNIGGHTIYPQWKKLFKIHPRYYYDMATNTLLLDGDWRCGYLWNCPSDVHLLLHIDKSVNIYLGDKFTLKDLNNYDLDNWRMIFSHSKVIVSPANKEFKEVKGILINKYNNKPF